MFIYNEITELFIKKIRLIALDILKETSIDARRSRFHYKGITYPLSFVVFENDKTLGFYDPMIYQVGINKAFITSLDEECLRNVIKHELAHFIVHIRYGHSAQAHGSEFKSIFEEFSWDKSFSKATINIEETVKVETQITKKIKKLLSLASSDNEHEARLATSKANALITKHNLQKVRLYNTNKTDIDLNELEDTIVLRVDEYKRRNVLHDGLYEVLQNFSVYPVFNSGRGGGYLEIIGTRENTQVANYIYGHIKNSLEIIWKITKKDKGLSGLRAKNSFIQSFLKSFVKELKHSPTMGSADTKDIIYLEKEMELHRSRVYKRLSKQSVGERSLDMNAWQLGSKAGKKFKLKSAITDKFKIKRLTN